MGKLFSQSFFIAAPTLTGDNVPDQKGRVHVVTGGYNGVGYEFVKILYACNATIFIAGRSAEKGAAAIERLTKEDCPGSGGKVEFLKLDLADLSTIKDSVRDLLARTDRIDVLTNNAGVMAPPAGSKTVQGHDLQMGTNCLGPFLFTKLLLPLLQQTASTSPPGSVRVTWAASVTTELSPKGGGLPMHEDGTPIPQPDQMASYSTTKVGNIYYATEMARRYGSAAAANTTADPASPAAGAILSVAWNPGNLSSDLSRHLGGVNAIAARLISHPVHFGAYTELYAACSPGPDEGGQLSLQNNGAYVVPWGKLGRVRSDIEKACQPGSRSGSGSGSGPAQNEDTDQTGQAGTGLAELFWYWSEKEVAKFC